MKRFLLPLFVAILSLSSFTTPVLGFTDADESELESYADRTCNPGSETCSCLFPNNATETVVGSSYTVTTCPAYCAQKASAFQSPQDTTYKLSCTNSNGQVISIAADNVDAYLREKADGANLVDRDPIIPNLNIKIPGFDPEGSIVVNEETGVQHSNLLGAYIQAVYQFLILAGSLIAVTMIMIGGLQYATARGDAGQVSKAKGRIQNAVTGVILLLLAYNIALIVDPSTTNLEPLSIKVVSRVENFPPEGEDLNIQPNTALSGAVVKVEGEALIAGSDVVLDQDTLTALQNAAVAFNQKTGKNVLVASGARDLREQVTLFYNNCLVPGGVCSVPTCNPAYDSPLIKKVGGTWQLQGELAGERSASVIITELAKSAKYGNCPHTSGIAVDAWCADGSMNFEHDPACQQELIKSMTENGFCRLGSEVWHFELDSKKVSTGCSTSNNTINYTARSGPQTPSGDCQKWDFKNHMCAVERVQ